MSCPSCQKAAASRRNRAGSTVASAFILGTANDIVYRVKVLSGYGELPEGGTVYVRGTLVPDLISEGVLNQLGAPRTRAKNSPKRIAYSVDGVIYVDQDSAIRKAEETGSTVIPVEV